MRLILFFCTLIVFTAQAQLTEIPLTENPVLEKIALENATTRMQNIQSFVERYKLPTPTQMRNAAETIYIVSGETLTFCQDTINQTGSGASFTCLNCEDFSYGTATLDSTCVTLATDANLVLETDTLLLEFCRTDTDCDVITCPIVIKRPNQSTTFGLFGLDATETQQFCIDTFSLPSTWQSMHLLGDTLCSEYEDFGSTITISGVCGLYQSTTFSDSDVACFVVCDAAQVCDTTRVLFEVHRDTLELPFFDDFSDFSSPYPNEERWLTNTVVINDNLGYQPPSVGVATFDGLDAGGRPYAMGHNLPSDILTSNYIDLSNTNEVFFSFYIQPKGLGDSPEIQDSLVLQFKNDQDQWVHIDAYRGLSSTVPFDSIPRFKRYFYTSEFDDPAFRHTGFQFRFYNKGSGTGILDQWHLDYVLLDSNNQGSVFRDVAFTERPQEILSPYSSMPWRQFEGYESQELNPDIIASIVNHSNQDANISGFAGDTSTVALTELLTDTEVYKVFLFNDQDANLPAGEYRQQIFNLDNNDIGGFPNVWTGANYLNTMQNDFNSVEQLAFDLEYILHSTENSSIGAAANDVVRRTTFFDNYFAYDDGSAETSLAAQGAGTQVAVEFHANQAEALTGVQMHIPRFRNNVSNQLINIKVWTDLNDDPVYETGAIPPVYVDIVADSLGGFTTYRFQDDTGELSPVMLPEGVFYVGWEQVSNEFNEAVPVGYDKNSPNGKQFIWQFLDGVWESFENFYIDGALMVRPLVGENIPFSTDATSISLQEMDIQFYPNPSNGVLYSKIPNQRVFQDFTLSVYTQTGQLVAEQELSPSINLSFLSNGCYFVKVCDINTRTITHEKLIIAK